MEINMSKMAVREGLSRQDTASTRGSNKRGLLKERKASMAEAWRWDSK